MSRKSETKIIVNYDIIGEVMNPILVIRPDLTEEWCQRVELHGSSTVQYDKHIVYTTTEAHVVTHIALEKNEKVTEELSQYPDPTVVNPNDYYKYKKHAMQ